MLRKIIFCLPLFVIFWAGAQNKKAAKYNNKIINIQHEVTPKIVRFFKTFEKGSLEELKAQQKVLIAEFDMGISKISAMKTFEGDAALRDAALDWFKFYKSSFEKEYNHILELVANRDRSKEDHEKLDKLTDELVKEEERVDDNFAKIQEAFAKRHNLELRPYPIEPSKE
ncbi:MAG: hypothetical protein MUF42_06190 [Cytophagaceae bacterium]|jgi:hypothetical protein|nr:hypothetical protein [Cytophagaceae bacterium]